MASVPTVKIKFPHKSGDYAIINESDFDAEKHEKYEDAPADPTPAKKGGKKTAAEDTPE